ncbi:MAG: AMP-binding protein [Eubacteriales bacterium]|nr:AMP-binding protein [Eubacteriales bacterium]
MQSFGSTSSKIYEVAARIRELREIAGYSQEEMAQRTEVSPEMYRLYEEGQTDFPFTFIHKCALELGVEITDLMEGKSARLTGYTVTRKGMGEVTAKETGLEIRSLAPLFKRKIAEPYFVRYEYVPEQQSRPIHLTRHSGQEFDLILSGSLKVQVGEHIEVLHEGDSIYYDSSKPHGMIAVDGADCLFCAVVLPGDETEELEVRDTIVAAKQTEKLIYENFVTPQEDDKGLVTSLSFHNTENFNFAFDIVDEMAKQKPDKLAMLHLDRFGNERRFSFRQISRDSSRAANYFKSLGIKKGDRVMLILRRHYQFWFCILGLHKLGAIPIPATNQLVEHDLTYRFNAAGVKCVVATGVGEVAAQIDLAMKDSPTVEHRIMVDGHREGWRNFDEEYRMFSSSFPRTEDAPGGDDPMLMLFTSGTTGYPKIATHSYKYPLGHFVTAKYWHCVNPNGLHLTISDTGWGKALWGKLYGQWMCEAATFVYDFDRFSAADILPLFKKYNITTFCAPPTMYRFMIKEDLSKYDLSSIEHATIAGEALNPEVFYQFRKATGISLMEGFGQTETALIVANLAGMRPKVGSMGKPVPGFDVDIVDHDGKSVGIGETGEIVVRLQGGKPNGLTLGYYNNETGRPYIDFPAGLYHTGDTAWRDEDGYYWYVGRVDDLIKSSGYRIGPFEIESVIMELPYVLECGVSAAPDEIRGQVVKASIVLVKGKEPTEALKKEIQDYVKHRTAPYKYPRIVVFRDELPKTISGKIQRNLL